MSRRLLLLAVACCLLPAVASRAEDWRKSPFHRTGFYAGLSGAYGFERGLEEVLEDSFGDLITRYNLRRGAGIPDNAPLKSYEVLTDGAAGANGRLGYRFLPWIAGELQVEYIASMRGTVKIITRFPPTAGGAIQPEVSETMTSAHEMLSASTNIKFLMPLGRVQPYALGGGGLVYAQTTGQYVSYCVPVVATSPLRCTPPDREAPKDLGRGVLEDGAAFGFRAGGGLDLYLTEHFVLNWEAVAVIPTGKLQNLNYYSMSWGLQYRF